MNVYPSNQTGWLDLALQALQIDGYVIVADVLDRGMVERSRAALYEAQLQILADIGAERIRSSGEIGTLRLLFKYQSLFFEFLEVPELLAVVDATLSGTAVLHTQNGLVLPSFEDAAVPTVFQNSFHRDFPRYMGGYLNSISILFALDPFTQENGGTLVVPGSHQNERTPEREYLESRAITAECSPGSMLVFDSTLWHAAGRNGSGTDRLGINHQFTRSFFKQQFDYVRAVGDRVMESLPERTQQLLGWYTRVVTNLDEYYQPEERRLYRRNQG